MTDTRRSLNKTRALALVAGLFAGCSSGGGSGSDAATSTGADAGGGSANVCPDDGGAAPMLCTCNPALAVGDGSVRNLDARNHRGPNGHGADLSEPIPPQVHQRDVGPGQPRPGPMSPSPVTTAIGSRTTIPSNPAKVVVLDRLAADPVARSAQRKLRSRRFGTVGTHAAHRVSRSSART